MDNFDNFWAYMKALARTISIEREKELYLCEADVGKKDLVIILNGPSAGRSVDSIKDHKNCEYMCVNWAPCDKGLFWDVKPKYLCIIDSSFFDKKGKYKEKCNELEKILCNRIDWNMDFLHFPTQHMEYNREYITEYLINNNIFNSINKYDAIKKYEKNRMSCEMYSVGHAAIYAGLILGFKSIYVYGLDADMFKNYCVDDKNHVIEKTMHYYGVNECDWTETAGCKGIDILLENDVKAFRMYRVINKLAKSMDANIYNCNKESMVDAFQKI